MVKKISFVVSAFILLWIGIRVLVAERVVEPTYLMMAGEDYVRQEWNYCSRFDKRPNPATMFDRATNYLNDVFFKVSSPIFWLENKMLSKRIEKDDPRYNKYIWPLQDILVEDWDYIVFPNRDGSKALVVKNRSIVQQIE